MNSPFLLLLLKENNRVWETQVGGNAFLIGALGLAQTFCCVSAEIRRAATLTRGYLHPKLHLNSKPILLQAEMSIHGPRTAGRSLPPPADCLVFVAAAPPLPEAPWVPGLSLMPVFHELTQPSSSFRPASLAWNKQGRQVQELLGWHKHKGWLGEIGAHFVRKQQKCWLLWHASEQRNPSSETT